MAAMLGRPFMPWQQQVADVAFEIDPDTGRLVYDEVDLTVPRQSGKTTLEMAAFTHRGLATRHYGPNQRMVYTAQKRKAARKKWKEDFLPDYQQATPLRGKWKPRSGPGDEGFDYLNGSMWGLEASTETTGHGSVLDLGFIDEAFAQIDGRLQQAFDPAMLTRAQPQLWVVSTMGWQGQMPYLWAKIERGRARCLDRKTESICYFEWSAPDGADPFDPATWHGCMPALGHTQTEERIKARLEAAESVQDFQRAYLNQVVAKPLLGELAIFDPDTWAACGDPVSQIAGAPALAIAMTPDRSTVSLLAAGARADGRMHVEVIEHGRSGSWFVPRVAAVAQRHGSVVAVHKGHAAGSLVPDLEAAGVQIEPVSTPEYVASCGALYDLVNNDGLRYPSPQPELDDAVARATRKPSGEAWKWAGEGISALVAASQAVWLANTRVGGGWMVSI